MMIGWVVEYFIFKPWLEYQTKTVENDLKFVHKNSPYAYNKSICRLPDTNMFKPVLVMHSIGKLVKIHNKH